MTTRVNEKTSEAKKKVKVVQSIKKSTTRAIEPVGKSRVRVRENVTLTHKLRAFSFSLVVCVFD